MHVQRYDPFAHLDIDFGRPVKITKITGPSRTETAQPLPDVGKLLNPVQQLSLRLPEANITHQRETVYGVVSVARDLEPLPSRV